MSGHSRPLPTIAEQPPADQEAAVPPGVVAEVRATMAGIRRVRRGLDPNQVHALLLAGAARELRLLGEARTAKEAERRAVDALRRWSAEHALTCPLVPGRQSRPGDQQVSSNHPNQPYPAVNGS